MVRRKRPSISSKASHAPKTGGNQNQFWLYGLHAVAAALCNPARRKWRLVTTENGANQLGREIAESKLTPEIAKADAIARLLPENAVHQGVALAVSPLPDIDLQTLVSRKQDKERQIVCILDQVTDPHNVGAILRSCAAFGAVALIVTGRNAAGESAVLAKTASGALEHVPMVKVTNLARTLDQLAELGFWRVGLDSAASQPITSAALEGNIALVLGAEGSGIRALTQKKCDYLLRLPTEPGFPSLNVSNAAAIALYAAATQNR
ncbi:MAG TPA: 23S rRNA (guanosine(2251)-2'-O)-methyltransferase RlmB [Alphaproteobacteria bacterium]|nr:23S rRNA (guanosine(2251)-2'-O)-methyltransferase RlmB [Alphaproteobacteria bacterium]HBC53037.1 23S rRNA (guanosine(2251)-2'-O)-methyltransferase RlmB [Alphaproteobacteria bacterium]HCO91316.1 23S rRNA (guanosine(2251)-2'-O)-methyltransferase RlmB [Alphaproteobacteria bacterium]